ncbi:MAG: dethiobiotin synthase [Oscillatoriales cyanobacterium SM2_1_8]|nr:dethiobiotin synthase [Oscillatoriales cyanobacterium SM2_1_8]
MPTLCITGIDTGVGKTVVTAGLAARWQRDCGRENVAVLKPVQAGVGDREYLQRVLGLRQTLAEICPAYYETPIASAIAQYREQKLLDLGAMWQAYQTLGQRYTHVAIEGVGGLGTPLTWDYTVADWLRDWRVPAVLVVPARLGAIGQTVAAVALARQTGVKLLGLVVNVFGGGGFGPTGFGGLGSPGSAGKLGQRAGVGGVAAGR